MTQHPHQLHAEATSWALRSARGHLTAAVATEDGQLYREAATIAAAADIQAWRPTIGRSAGGHGDPVAHAATWWPTIRPGRLAQLARSIADTLTWLADRLKVMFPAADPLLRLHAAIPRLRPSTAEQLQLWLAEADGRIRAAIHLDPAEQILPGLACPACGIRQLYALTAGPDPTVICRAGCRCAGTGCTCGMPVQPTGSGHIWGAGSSLGRRAALVLAA